MKEYIKKLPQDVLQLIYASKETAHALGVNAYLVGGFVRDLLLGVTNLDVDIAVEGNGIAYAQALAVKLNAKLTTHRRFGTATLMVKPHVKIDIASTRKEIYPHPGSLPVVAYGSIEDDLTRRDFTINALAISITGEEFGTLKDICAGKDDLRGRLIRVLHDLSFIDDPTRIVRAIRFEKRYGFRLESKTRSLLKESVKRGMLERVEPQRLRDEIIVMLKERMPSRQVRRLDQLAGLGFIHKKVRLTGKIAKFFNAIDVQVSWFLQEHYHRRHLDTWLMYFIALMDPLDKKEVMSVCKKFVFRKGEEKRILDSKSLHGRFIRTLSRKNILPSKAFTMLERVSYENIILLKAKCPDAHFQRNIENYLRIHDSMRISVSGHDLRGLGVAPGPCYQKIFRKILNARIDGKLTTKEEELEFAKKLSSSLTKYDTQKQC